MDSSCSAHMAFGGGLRLKARGESLSKMTRPAQHTWHSIWLFTCFVGMCAGFMLSQRLYLHWHTLASPSAPSSPLQAAGDSLALQPLPGQPRSEVDSILRHIAPQREVMVAISNYAPVAQGMLPTFLEVRLIRLKAGSWVWKGGWPAEPAVSLCCARLQVWAYLTSHLPQSKEGAGSLAAKGCSHH